MTSPDERRRTVSVQGLARVEGEGSLRVEVRDGRVEDVELQIFEPPRFFEAFLRGRRATEAPDLTARICGICPVAYQMSACAAVEDALGISVHRGVADLRRLLYCGEWLQSHSLHVHMLHAPDFLGCQDAVEMAQRHRAAFERGLALKKTGNRIMEAIGGRAIHPVNVKVGGFYRAPSREEVAALAGPLSDALDLALATVAWVAGFDFPDVHGDYRFVALRDAGRYPLESGRVASSDGLDTTPGGFADLVVEEQVARSTALHARLENRLEYLTGPLARYALNSAQLPDVAARAAADAGLGPTCTNPFQSIIVRAVEIVFACQEALMLVERYEPPDPPSAPVPSGGGEGTGATEAPRGLLFHRYRIDQEGLITAAQIVPPTSQNQITIESDIRRTVQASLDLSDDELTWRSEQAVRNHDPCISCATHFLDLTVIRR
ncbi:MAG: Ni/Fe hydrogenase subunit alpha [Acidimicrobiales bacterium]